MTRVASRRAWIPFLLAGAIGAGASGVRAQGEDECPHTALGVVPTGWWFTFQKGDHEIQQHELHTEAPDWDRENQVVRWQTRVRFADKNADDRFRWKVFHGLVGLPMGYTRRARSVSYSHSGSEPSLQRGEHQVPAGFDVATVILTGWSFRFVNTDHHLDRIGIRLRNVAYDPATGRISWEARAHFADKNSDDDFWWSYEWLVIAYDGGAAVSREVSGRSSGGKMEREVAFGCPGCDVVLPQGWYFNFVSSDHELRRHRASVVGGPVAGGIRADYVVEYSDKNRDDDYRYRFDLVGLDLGQGRFVNVPPPASAIPSRGGGGRRFEAGTGTVAPPIVPVWEKARVVPDSAELCTADQVSLATEIRDSCGDWHGGTAAAWSSGDEAVATVDEGAVTAVSAGTAAITATVASLSATASINVVGPISCEEVSTCGLHENVCGSVFCPCSDPIWSGGFYVVAYHDDPNCVQMCHHFSTGSGCVEAAPYCWIAYECGKEPDPVYQDCYRRQGMGDCVARAPGQSHTLHDLDDDFFQLSDGYSQCTRTP